MKQGKDFRGKVHDHGAGDSMKKPVKLAPNKKSGKERHAMYHDLEEEEDTELEPYMKKESVLDYFDDEEEDV